MTLAQPPLTPEETLRRVLRAARLDGLSVVVVSGCFGVGSLFFGDVVGAVIGLLVCGTGAAELRGRSLLLAGQARGMNWLVASQAWFLVIVLAYVWWQLSSYNPALAREYILPVLRSALVEPLLSASGVSEAQMLQDVKSIYVSSYMIAGTLSFCFQGGLALYYRNRRAAVTAALAAGAKPGAAR